MVRLVATCLVVYVMSIVINSSTVYAQAQDITMSRDNGAIAWDTGSARSAEYKDVQVARDPDGALMLYLPLTRAVAGNQFDTIYIWDGGSGQFVDQTATLLPFINPAIDRGTYDVDFVDIDGDDDYDIVHSSPHGNRIYVNKRNEAEGSFIDQTTTRLPSFMTDDALNIWDDVTAGDVDGDGDQDLMFSNRNHGVHADAESNWGPNVLAYNDGSGHFGLSDETRELYGQPATLADGTIKLEGSSHGAKFADLNNDGRLDLIISHESNYGFGGGAAPDYEIMINLGDVDADGKVNWSSTPITQNGKSINVGIFDYDNDGNLDIYLARGGATDEILLGLGDGSFAAPTEVQLLSGGVNSLSYDVAFGDFNNDGEMDIITVNADGGDTTNLLYLNDRNNPDGAAPRLLVSNAAEFNPAADPYSMLSAQPVDHDGDGDLDVILGADARAAGRTPLVIDNELDADDAILPILEHPKMLLAASADPSVLFRMRIRDRVIDFDEIEAQISWSTTGLAGGAASGSQPMKWGAQMTYQALLSCSALRGNTFVNGEAINSINWTVEANDAVATNISTMTSGDVGVPNLLPQLQASVGSAGIGINIIEPMGGAGVPIVRADGTDRLLIRVTVSPSNLIPSLNEFTVTVNGDVADILSIQKVGDQVWLAIEPPMGPGGVHDIIVSYGVCGLPAINDIETNAVAYDDNPDDTDTVLVIDLSGSMNSDDKLAAAVNAGKLFVNTLRDQDKIGVVQYSGSTAGGATTSFDLALADSLGRGGAIAALDGLSASGCTPLGAGLEQGLVELDNLGALTPNPSRSLILLSDGLENIAPFWDAEPSYKCSTAAAGIPVSNAFSALNGNLIPEDDVRVDTVALGPNASISLMSTIALATGGKPRQVLDTAGTIVSGLDDGTTFANIEHLIISPAMAQPAGSLSSLANNLAGIYEHFHNGISGQDRLWQSVDVSQARAIKRSELGFEDNPYNQRLLGIGEREEVIIGRTINVSIPDNLSFATIAINWEDPRNIVSAIIPPGPQLQSSIQNSTASTNTVFKITDPVPGVWRVVLRTEDSFEALSMLSGVSNITVFARALTPTVTAKIGENWFERPKILEPGDDVPVALMLIGNNPIMGADVFARATSVGNGQELFRLLDDGQGADTEADDGIYTGVVMDTGVGGTINVEIEANWQDAFSDQNRIVPLSIEIEELDSDGDTISDIIEQLFKLNPNNPNDAFADPDRDNLPTWLEIVYSLDPYNADSDGGGTPDGMEVAALTDPEDGSDDEKARIDVDGDGLPSSWEVAYGLDPNDPSDAEIDLDGDGLSNEEEFANFTAPNKFDTDGDGMNDGEEVAKGLNPNDPLNRDEGITEGEHSDLDDMVDKYSIFQLLIYSLLAILVIFFLWILIFRRNP